MVSRRSFMKAVAAAPAGAALASKLGFTEQTISNVKYREEPDGRLFFHKAAITWEHGGREYFYAEIFDEAAFPTEAIRRDFLIKNWVKHAQRTHA